MSWTPTEDPQPGDHRACDALEQVIVPRARDLGGFSVRRALPAAGRQMVGPFIFFDQMGPAEFLVGTGIDVRPHPHIGLATVTTCSTARSCTVTASARPLPSSRVS
jgi:redox-sensitive bicupin YhaK (pirin superfamily)